MYLEKYIWGSILKARFLNTSFKSRLVNVDTFYPDPDTYDENKMADGNGLPYNDTSAPYVYRTESVTATPPRKVYPPRLIEIINNLKQKCIYQHSLPSPFEADESFCNRTMDGFAGCWPDTAPGEIAVIPCPVLPRFNPNHFATKECTRNGTWYVNSTTGNEWANYTSCFHGEEVNHAKYIYIFIGGFSLSLIMLVMSLVIFLWFRQLRCDRITIHKNLFASYILTGISWLIYYSAVSLNGEVQIQNPIWCRAVHILCQYFTVCNFFWMFCEGLYLNTIMVFAFNSGKIVIPTCYIIGWGLPIILTVVYTCIRENVETANRDCWSTESNLQWIMYGPIVFSLAVNVLFLINIVRLLITKLRQMPEADQTKKATRATLILVPLLGLQYLLFPIRPAPGSSLEDVYHILVALLVSYSLAVEAGFYGDGVEWLAFSRSQATYIAGTFVSLMYCFCNGEVIAVLRRKWNQHTLMSKSSMRASAMHGTTYTSIGTTFSTACPAGNQGSNCNNTYTTTETKEAGVEMVNLNTQEACL